MSKHHHTRRNLFKTAGSSALAVLGGAGTAAALVTPDPDWSTATPTKATNATAGSDAELIRHCANCVALETAWRAASAAADGDPPQRQEGYRASLDFITAATAVSVDGNRAKLAVVVSFYDPEFEDHSIVDPALWDAVRALALSPEQLIGAAAKRAKAEELDGELLRLCAEFQRLEAEYRRRIDASEDADPPDDYDDAIYAVAQTPARTIQGLRAKAGCVVAFYQADFPRHYPIDRMVWSVIEEAAAGRAVA